MIYSYRGTITRVVDGDTLDAVLTRDLDLGFRVRVVASTTQRLRLLRADTPERGQMGWAEATEFVRAWVATHPDVVIRTEKSDVFGRYLAEIESLDGSNLSTELLAAGHAVEWSR